MSKYSYLTLQECIDKEAKIPAGMPFADMTEEERYICTRVDFYTWNGYDYEDLPDDDEIETANS